MTIKQFTDDYVENKGLRMIALARMSGEYTALLNVNFATGATMGFLTVGAQMNCLLIKHRPLFRQFFGKVMDLDDDILLDYWDTSNDWNDLDRHMMSLIKERVIENIGVLYGC